MTRTDDLSLRVPDRQGEPAAMARYAGLDQARDAIEQLEAHGVDGDDIVLAGWRAQSAAGSQHRNGADGRLVRYVGRRTGRGVIVGGGLGTLLGAAVGGIAAAVWPDTFEAWWGIILVAAIFGSGLGALLGAFIQVERHVGFSEAWTVTLQDVPDGSVWVLLFDDSLRAREALEATRPADVRRGDAARLAPDER